MTNRKTTRRALVLSLLSLLVCCSMLVGTTFAWFTDSVTSGNNKIVAGNLDVEVYYGEPSAKNSIESVATLFNDVTLWEPGAVAYENLTVVNEGTLALKYQLDVNFSNENKVGEYGLSQILKVGVVEKGIPENTSREDAVKLVESWLPMASFSWEGELAAKTADDTVALVIYWEPSAEDNNWNVNNGKTVSDFAETQKNELHIDLGINLFATQLEAELDSFGNDYDKDAIYSDVLVSTADELYAAVAAAEDGTIIAIDGNIVLNKALSRSGLKSITFVAYDEDATIDQATYNMHFSGAKVTFENLTLTHGEKTYGNGGQTSTAFAVWDANEVNYLNCTFNRSVGTIHAATHNFIGCTFNGVENPDNSKSEYPLYICDGENYNVVDCVFNCTNRGAILFYNDGGSGVDTLNISNTKFYGDIIADKAAVEIHNNSATQVYNVNITDAVVGTGIINGLYRIKPANVGEVNVDVDGVKTGAKATNQTELNEALAATTGEMVVELGSGEYIIPDSAKNRTLTIVGNGETVIASQDDGAAEGDCDYSFEGSTVTFENVTITTSTTYFPGYARMKGIYNNCTINGVYTLYDNSTFNNCTFNVSGDVYNVWTWGAAEATFNGCTFNSDGKAILLYGGVDTKLTLNDCVFNDNGGLTDLKAAVEIGNDYGRSYELIVNNTVVNGYEINDKGINTGSTLWGNKNSMGTDKLNVVIDGVDVY